MAVENMVATDTLFSSPLAMKRQIHFFFFSG
jgi:hypothetical protein